MTLSWHMSTESRNGLSVIDVLDAGVMAQPCGLGARLEALLPAQRAFDPDVLGSRDLLPTRQRTKPYDFNCNIDKWPPARIPPRR